MLKSKRMLVCHLRDIVENSFPKKEQCREIKNKKRFFCEFRLMSIKEVFGIVLCGN
jgi:hypothetical protein